MKYFFRLTHPLAASALVAGVLFGSIGCASLSAGDLSKQSSLDNTTQNYSANSRIKRHVYAGVGLGSSWMNPDTGDATVLKVNERVAVGRQLSLGVDLSKQIALELHSSDLGSAGLSPGGRVEYNINGASALLYAGKSRHNYKRQGFSGFGRVGYGYLDGSAIGDINLVLRNQSHVLFGAGLEYMTRLGLGFRAEAISFDKDARYMQVGLVYRLGKQRAEKPVEIAKVTKPPPVPTPKPKPVPVPAIAAAKKIIAPQTAIDICKQLHGTLDGVNFHSNSQALTGSAMAALDDVAEKLRNCTSIPILISAHTDSVGDANDNLKLSGRRAATVAKYLFDRGIAKGRLRAKAYGELRPIDTNDTEVGRKRNRRVELIVAQ